ncbi:MAG TPA: hypothetical protein VIS48_04585 [Candidatus Kryptonia bacterium]
MPKSFKPTVVFVFILAVVFAAFFFVSKHVTALARVNPFSEDPFDAVGGFGVQLTLFTAIVSMLRVFIPRSTSDISASQKLLVIRGCTVSVQSVAVTLAAYVVAMIRYPSEWIFSPQGRILAFLVAGMTILAAITAWRIDLLAYNAGLSADLPARRMALINCLVGILILGIYPAEWRQTIFGSIVTAVLGVVVLLLLTWALAAALSPRIDIHIEDFLDDLGSLGKWLESKGKVLAGIVKGLGKILSVAPAESRALGINPRKHPWNFAIVVSLVAGILLALFKASTEGLFHDTSRLILVSVTMIGIEFVGVLLGHFLFTRYLGIFRVEE